MTSILFLIDNIYRILFICKYLWKQKTFFEFLSAILKRRLSFEYFKKKMTLIAKVFSKLRTPEKAIR